MEENLNANSLPFMGSTLMHPTHGVKAGDKELLMCIRIYTTFTTCDNLFKGSKV